MITPNELRPFTVRFEDEESGSEILHVMAPDPVSAAAVAEGIYLRDNMDDDFDFDFEVDDDATLVVTAVVEGHRQNIRARATRGVLGTKDEAAFRLARRDAYYTDVVGRVRFKVPSSYDGSEFYSDLLLRCPDEFGCILGGDRVMAMGEELRLLMDYTDPTTDEPAIVTIKAPTPDAMWTKRQFAEAVLRVYESVFHIGGLCLKCAEYEIERDLWVIHTEG